MGSKKLGNNEENTEKGCDIEMTYFNRKNTNFFTCYLSNIQVQQIYFITPTKHTQV